MNKFKFFLPLAAVGLLASCSNDNLGEPNSDQPVTPGQATEVDGTYFNINLSIPTVGSRADNGYVTGDANEYAVYDAYIYVFNEDNNQKPDKLIKGFNINQYFTLPNGSVSEITGVKKLEGVKLDDLGLTKNTSGTYDPFYVLVILNQDGGVTAPVDQQTFTDWSTTAQTSSMMPTHDGVTYFTMTNALGWNISGLTNYSDVTAPPAILTRVTNANIHFENQTTSLNGGDVEDVNIFVQRAVAKVSIDGSSAIKVGKWSKTKSDAGIPGTTTPVDYIKITGWALDNTNNKTYPTQMLSTTGNDWWNGRGMTIDDDSKWGTTVANAPFARFATLTNPASETKYARCFWGVDPNYNIEITAENLSENFTNLAQNATLTADNEAYYCLENTFDVAHMIQKHTTRVVLEGIYLPQMTEAVEEDGEPTLKNFISYNGNYFVPDADFEAQFMDYTKVDATTKTIAAADLFKSFDRNSQTTKDWAKNKYESSLTGDEWTSASDEAKLAECMKMAEEYYYETLDQILEKLKVPAGSDALINFHENGHVYYTVLLRHFNDAELNLATDSDDLGDYLKYDTASKTLYLNYETYPNDQDHHLLGRYGTLRNNWYALVLNSVSAVGTSYIPAPSDRTDDDQGTLIDVVIYINAWAKRGQSVTFQ